MNIIITGIAGFLGGHAANILKKDFNIIGINGLSSRSNIGDIKTYDAQNIGEIIEKPDTVIMCHAAISSGNLKTANQKLYDANVKFTQDVVNTFPDTYHLYISSVSVYGNNAEILNEN